MFANYTQNLKTVIKYCRDIIVGVSYVTVSLGLYMEMYSLANVIDICMRGIWLSDQCQTYD